MASACGPPLQNTRLDSEIVMQRMMVNQLRKLEEMMARRTLELHMASATSHSLHTHLLTIVVTQWIPVRLRDLKVSQKAYGFEELYSKLAVVNDLHSS